MIAVVLFLLIFFGVPLVCWLAVRAARDMDARGEAGWRYGLLVLCLAPIGVVVWLAARARHPLPVDR
ncbi:MAG TPA: hypothetical protein VFE55_09805 [Acidimicrobiia bacterium]|nr:hypothetical protein [Acidimicrobiia bacterium]